MTRERAPFVSGLPGELANAAPPAGVDMLGRIRARAKLEADGYAHAARERFDGVERIPADPAAVAAVEEFAAIVALVDGILTDAVLRLRIAALLARGRA